MSDANMLERWIGMQARLLHGVNAERPATLVLEKGNGDRVGQWPITLETLAEEVNEVLSMQAAELAIGNHQFRVVIQSPAGECLAQLPQVVRGRSKDAASAASEALIAQRANAMAVQSLTDVVSKLERVLDAQTDRLLKSQGETDAVSDKLKENFLENSQVMLKIRELEMAHENTQAIIKELAPLGMLIAQHLLSKMGNGGVATDLLSSLMKGPNANAEQPPVQPAEPTAPEPELAGKPEPPVLGTTVEQPDHAIVLAVSQPSESAVRRNGKKRPEGNRRTSPAKHRRAN